MAIQLTALEASDEPLIWQYLALASHDSPDAVRAHPLLARYAQGWGREGDFGFKGETLVNGTLEPVGLVWSRLYPAEAPGFGFVAPDVPELSIAVKEDERGHGLGRLLLRRYLGEARLRFRAVSLNVRETNLPALQLYERAGFGRVEGSEMRNRTGGISFNMILRL